MCKAGRVGVLWQPGRAVAVPIRTDMSQVLGIEQVAVLVDAM
jgi:hypothetical protein